MIRRHHPRAILAGPTLFAGIVLAGIVLVGIALSALRSEAARWIRPIDGSLVLAGDGPTPDCVLQAFLHLCGGASPDVVVVTSRNSSSLARRWSELGANTVEVMKEVPANPDELTRLMLSAEGVWFDGEWETGNAHASEANSLFRALVLDVMKRGGVVGGRGAGARTVVNDWALLSQSSLHTEGSKPKAHTVVQPGDGRVEWTVASSAALIVHQGRRVGALGEGSVVARIPAHNKWSEREATVQAIDVFDYHDQPPYQLDLLSWQRSARDRSGPIFPSPKIAKPQLARGTLILHGGRRVSQSTFERFIEAAGGKNAVIVTIPSAQDIEAGDQPDSYSAGKLRDLGCSQVFVLHADDPEHAHQNRRLLAPLEKATGVWIDGGRTYRMMDRFEKTHAHELIGKVLARGGVVGGSSAGCQVPGEFLVRGNPRTNRDLAFDGYTRGLGLLPGVVLDAHFLQRDRHESFQALVDQHPQLLGIGVDENTAIVVRGREAEVVGENAVSFYDRRPQGRKKSVPEVMILKAGRRFDMVKRRPTR